MDPLATALLGLFAGLSVAGGLLIVRWGHRRGLWAAHTPRAVPNDEVSHTGDAVHDAFGAPDPAQDWQDLLGAADAAELEAQLRAAAAEEEASDPVTVAIRHLIRNEVKVAKLTLGSDRDGREHIDIVFADHTRLQIADVSLLDERVRNRQVRSLRLDHYEAATDNDTGDHVLIFADRDQLISITGKHLGVRM